MTSRPPIFILGVPRSGTTLLRTILDGHPAIAAGPETPWLGGHQPRSLMALWGALREEGWGYCQSYNMPLDVPTEAARAFMNILMDRYCQSRGKSRWAEKTPDNALYVPFLRELFPDARFIYLIRDGLDTAMSTSVVAPHRKGISAFLEQNLGFGPGVPHVVNTPFAAVLRWKHWNNLIRAGLANHTHHKLSYERLVTEPTATIRELLDFVGEPFEPAMLDYAKLRHDFPRWEWGSADVMARGAIGNQSVGRARRELSADELGHLAPMIGPDQSQGQTPGPGVLGSWIASFAIPMHLESPAPEAQAALAWLWHSTLLNTANTHLRVVGSPTHSLPWILALLGAKVTFESPLDDRLTRLAAAMKVDVNRQTTEPSAALLLNGLPDAAQAPRCGAFVLGPVGPKWNHRVLASLPAGAGSLGASILSPA